MNYPLEILSDYADISWGNTSITKASYVEKGYPAFSAAGQDGFLPVYEFDEDGIVLSAIGARCGKCFFAKRKWTAIKNTITITSKDTKLLNLTYLFHIVNNEKFWPQRGGGQPFIALGDARKVKVPLPDIDDQKRIAHLLGKLAGLIARRKQHLLQLDDLLKSVFLEMFGDPVRNEKEWDKKQFSKLLADIESGKSPKCEARQATDEEWGVLKLGAVTSCVYEESENKALPQGIDPQIKHEVKRGDLLFSRKNTYELVAACAYVFDTRPRLLMPDLIFRFVFKDDAKINPIFIWKLLTSAPQRKKVQSLAAGAAGSMPNISKTKLKQILLPIPPLELQNQFAAIVEKVEGLKSCYQQNLADLETLYGALSQKAFKGELDLSRVPLPLEGMDRTEGEKDEADERVGMLSAVELPDPENLTTLVTAEGRKALIVQWAKAWIQQLGTFSVQHFMETVQQRLWDLVDTQDRDSTSLEYEEIQFGLVEYDELKVWVFEALVQGRLTQGYDDAKNRVQITAAKG